MTAASRKITRKAALAAGLKHYYTGPCAEGHRCGRYAISAKCVECLRRYNATSAARKRRKRYETTPRCRRYRKRYGKSPAGIAASRRGQANYRRNHPARSADQLWRWRNSPKGQEWHRRYNQTARRQDQRWHCEQRRGTRVARRWSSLTQAKRDQYNAQRRRKHLAEVQADYAATHNERDYNRLMRCRGG